MIDLHAHLLPGVDDGPTTWDEAITMVRMAVAEGVTAMVATSHMMAEGAYVNTRERLLALTEELADRVQAAGIEMAIYPGAEVYMTPDVPDRLERGELLTYCDAGRYMLVEMSATEIPSYAHQVIDDLCLLGVTPIIAHPERNLDILRQPSRAHALVERGAMFQVTASSVRAKQPIRGTARFLFRHGLVHFLASDAHGVYNRRPRFAPYLADVQGWVGNDMVERLVEHNPAAVVAGESVLPVASQRRSAPPQRLWQSIVRRFGSR